MRKELYVLFGPPGAGKSTQTALLEQQLKLRYLSWGAVSRKIMEGKPNATSKLLRKAASHDAPLPLKIVSRILSKEMRAALASPECKGIILDGFPRRKDEAENLLAMAEQFGLGIKAAIRFNIDRQTLLERTKARQTCATCGAPSAENGSPGVCRIDGGTLVKRKDDRSSTAASRFLRYLSESPEAYAIVSGKAQCAFDVDANQSELNVFAEIVTKLNAGLKASYKMYKKTGSTPLQTEFGTFRLVGFQNIVSYEHHLALVYGDVAGRRNVPVRLHSSCITGDIFSSLRCDCGPQLNAAMRHITEHGSGVILYLFQEGRGINILNQIEAYRLQNQGLDTVEANEKIGLPTELRDYRPAKEMLDDLEVKTVNLLTNSPDKVHHLLTEGVIIEQRLPLIVKGNPINARYRRAQIEKMGHVFAG